MGKLVRLAFQKRAPSQTEKSPDIPRELVDQQLQRILASDLFANSDRLRRLLQFVAEETLAGRRDQLKEYNLGIAVFDRGAAYDPRTDPIVRVEAGRLRTRLGNYYATAGAGDPLILDLPKGGYWITVQPRKAEEEPQPPPAPRRRAPDWRTATLAATVVVACVLLANNIRLQRQLARSDRTIPGEVNALWGPFLAPAAETAVVFGSPMFFESEQKRVYVRPYDINDPASARGHPEFSGLQKLLGPLSEPQYTYAQIGDALALHRLGAFFGRYGKTAEAIPANLSTWESIRDKNIILVGSARMLPLLHRLPVQLDFDVQPDRDVLNRNPRPGEETVYSTPSHSDTMSYAIIASSPGLKPGREILIFTSHGSAGTDAAVEYFTQQETLRDMASKLGLPGGTRRDYQVLLRVLADKDEAFKTEYITHHTVLRSAR